MQKFITRILIFLVVVLIAIITHQVIQFNSDTYFTSFKDELEVKVDNLIFGSSINAFCGTGDTDWRKVSEMLNDFVPDKEIMGFSRPSAQLRNYLSYLQKLEKDNKLPNNLIVPVDMQLYTPVSDNRPEYLTLQVNEHIFLQKGKLAFIFRHFVPGLQKAYKNISYTDLFNKKVSYFDRDTGIVADYYFADEFQLNGKKDKIARVYFILYMADICDEVLTDRIQPIISICERNKVGLSFYLTPVDYQKGVKYCGNEFCDAVKKNNQKFKEYISGKNQIPVYDYSFDLDSTCFDHGVIPNPHMNQKGKLHLAKSLAEDVFHINE